MNIPKSLTAEQQSCFQSLAIKDVTRNNVYMLFHICANTGIGQILGSEISGSKYKCKYKDQEGVKRLSQLLRKQR